MVKKSIKNRILRNFHFSMKISVIKTNEPLRMESYLSTDPNGYQTWVVSLIKLELDALYHEKWVKIWQQFAQNS